MRHSGPRPPTALASTLFFMREDLGEAVRLASLADELAAGTGEPVLRARTLGMKGLIEAVAGRPAASDALDAAEALGETPSESSAATPSFHRSIHSIWVDRRDAAAALTPAVQRGALAQGDEGSLGSILAELALAHYVTGRWGEAAAAATEGHDDRR